jgi:hypothetical protein
MTVSRMWDKVWLDYCLVSDHSPIVVRVQFQVSEDCLQNVGQGCGLASVLCQITHL